MKSSSGCVARRRPLAAATTPILVFFFVFFFLRAIRETDAPLTVKFQSDQEILAAAKMPLLSVE